jgi:MFS family permease
MIFTGLIIGAICGTLIGFITQWWGWGLIAAIGFVIVWLVAERLWWRRRPEDREIEDPYGGR